jgi:chlorophyll synthase
MKARPVDFVFLLRPTALVPAWLFVARGAALATGEARPVSLLPGTGTTLALAAVTAVLGGGYVLNQITDIETDSRNDKLFLLPRGVISVRSASVLMATLWAAAVVPTLFLPAGAALAMVAALLLCVTYSAPPVRAKAVPGLDLVWNGLGFGVVSTAAGWYGAGGGASLPFASLAGYALAVAGLIASTTIPDIEGDSAAGLSTTGVVLGRRGAGAIAAALMGAALVLAVLTSDIAGAVAAGTGLVLLLVAQVADSRGARIAASQGTVAAYVIAMGVRSPWLLLLLGAVVLGSRVYYRRRFGIVYPGRGTP